MIITNWNFEVKMLFVTFMEMPSPETTPPNNVRQPVMISLDFLSPQLVQLTVASAVVAVTVTDTNKILITIHTQFDTSNIANAKQII